MKNTKINLLLSGPCWKLFDMKKRLLILLLFCQIPVTGVSEDGLTAISLFNKMMAAMKQVRTCSFILDIEERINGEMKLSKFIVKLQTKPYKLYAYSVRPNPGAEALLIEGHNNGKVLINPNRFPYVNISLSPYNGLLRKNHQYTMLQMGFEYVTQLLDAYQHREGAAFLKKLSYRNELSPDLKNYHTLIIDNPDFALTKVTVKKGETITSIANRLFVNDRMILELNPGCSDYDDVKPGDVLIVPNGFAKKIVFHIDKKSMLPLIQTTYDHKGHYGTVIFSSFVLNPQFDDIDFSRNNPKYNF